MKSGTTVESINSDALMTYKIPVASKEEQKEIIDIITRMVIKEEKAVEAAELLIDQIESMKKSILAKAFRGELGTNDPSEEPVAL